MPKELVVSYLRCITLPTDAWQQAGHHMNRTAAERPSIAVLAASPLERPPIAAFIKAVDITDPIPLKNAITGGIEREAFPYVSSLSRNWRYYLLLGPNPNAGSAVNLGRRLINIVKANSRGIGKNLLSVHKKQKRAISDMGHARIANRLKSEYGVAKAFWLHVQSGDGLFALTEASKSVRRATKHQYRGFFSGDGPLPLGHAKNAFHRIIRDQSKSSMELAKLLARKQMNLMDVVISANFKKLSNDLGRLLLAWALLQALYKNLPRADLKEDDAEDTPEGGKALADLAKVAIMGLRAGLVPNIAPKTRTQLVGLLRDALARSARTGAQYIQPLVAPPLQPGRTRQRVYADLRLSSFATLLRTTR